MNIWDTCGQERFRSMTKNLHNNVNGIMFVYDITNKPSFDAIKSWLKELEMNKPEIKRIIVGNNCHLENKREVKKEYLETFYERHNIKGIEVSSKDGTNVNECFEMLVKLIIENKTKEELIEEFSKKEQI